MMLTITDWQTLSDSDREAVLQRPTRKQRDIASQVALIIKQVRGQGDAGLLALTKQYDGASLDALRVSDADIHSAKMAVDPALLQHIQLAIERISDYQQACLPKTITVDKGEGIICRRIPRPIEKVGLYVPGGTAPLLSTLMMLAVPANIAGCRKRVLCTPPNAEGNIHPVLLATAALCQIDTVYKIGGAQAIAAMAYGTETVPAMDKLFGPGNAWVTAAKQAVAHDPDGAMIDLPAGPSEVLVIADEDADAAFVAADLLSQAEHGVDSQAILLTPSKPLAQAVLSALKQQLSSLSRQTILHQSLYHSRIIVVNTVQEAITLSNQYAPEHLILHLDDPEQHLASVQHAAAVFVGQWTPETMGDYVNGANHVLPTEGYARCLSGLSVADFMKYISVQQVTAEGLQRLGPTAMRLAEVEQLSAHQNAVAIRLNQLERDK